MKKLIQIGSSIIAQGFTAEEIRNGIKLISKVEPELSQVRSGKGEEKMKTKCFYCGEETYDDVCESCTRKGFG